VVPIGFWRLCYGRLYENERSKPRFVRQSSLSRCLHYVIQDSGTTNEKLKEPAKFDPSIFRLEEYLISVGETTLGLCDIITNC